MTTASDDFTAQDKALILVPKFMSMLSILGSATIIHHIFRTRHGFREMMTYHRLLFGLAICDIVLSIWYFLGSWMIPVDTEGVFWASGTTATCTASGFFIQGFALCTAMYSGSLCTYYILKFVKERPPSFILKVEPYLHIVPLVVGVGTAIVGLPLDLYNSAAHVCWIMPLPDNCGDGPDEPACVRGKDAWIYQWAFLYAEVWSVFLFVSIAFYIIYRKVNQMERATQLYISNRIKMNNQDELSNNDATGGMSSGGTVGLFSSPSGNSSQLSSRQTSKSRIVAVQALQYILSFCATWFFATVARVTFSITGNDYFITHILKVTFFPLQGFWNALIYLRPHYFAWRQCRRRSRRGVSFPEQSFYLWGIVYWVEMHCCCCYRRICCHRESEDGLEDNEVVPGGVQSPSEAPADAGLSASLDRQDVNHKLVSSPHDTPLSSNKPEQPSVVVGETPWQGVVVDVDPDSWHCLGGLVSSITTASAVGEEYHDEEHAKMKATATDNYASNPDIATPATPTEAAFADAPTTTKKAADSWFEMSLGITSSSNANTTQVE